MVNRNYSNNYLNISQRWFLLNPKVNRELSVSQKWFVPFTFTTKDELDFNFEKEPIWLKPDDSSSEIN